MCKILPENLLSSEQKDQLRRDFNSFEENIKNNKRFDSGLSK